MNEVKAIFRGSRITYHHVKSNSYFGRIAAGIGFPGSKPGYCCIFGEERREDRDLRIRPVHLLTEVEESVTGELLRKVADLAESYEVQGIFGHLDDQTFYYLDQFNEAAEKRDRPTADVREGPYLEDSGGRLENSIRLLQDRLSPRQKSVHLGEGSRLQAYLMQLSFDQIPQATARDWPAIAAACHVVSALNLWEPIEERDLPESYLPADFHVYGD